MNVRIFVSLCDLGIVLNISHWWKIKWVLQHMNEVDLRLSAP